MRRREKMEVMKTHKDVKQASPVKGKQPQGEEEQIDDPIEKGKELDRKRGFLS